MLAGKKAIITGASSGIGRAIALALDAEGCQVALLARRKEKLEALTPQLDNEALILPFDLSVEREIKEAVTLASAKWEGVDILINSAGVGRQASLTDGATSDWRDMLDINVLALAMMTREVLPHFPKSGGHVVNVSSMSGHRVPGRGGFYSATKFAVRAMTEGLRQELRYSGNHTRVSSISPGFVDTELLDDYFKSSRGGIRRQDAIQYPILQPEEVAQLVLHQLNQPENVEVTDLLVRPTRQAT